MKTKFKKRTFGKGSKLFTINNFKYDQNKFLLDVGRDVYDIAREFLGYDLSKPKKLESFLRKCFRSYYDSRPKRMIERYEKRSGLE